MSEHSPLGASAMERWQNCPGSNVILNTLDLPPSEESDFAKEGTAAHDAAAHCLREKVDTFELYGREFLGYPMNEEMMAALQLYLDTLAEVRGSQKTIKELVEYRISGDFHPLFFGTVDSAIVGEEWLDVTDLKYGAGIAVDVERNPQLMYYAVGILDKFMGPTKVRLRIVQPRAFHADGPVRVWETTTQEILQWKKDVLIPAMNRAEVDVTLTPGDHCRFCPAKLVCPVLTGLFGAATQADASALVNFSDASLARNYTLVDAVKHYIKALEAETYRRLSIGNEVPGFKLVPKKANRVFTTEGAAKVFEQFGEDAYDRSLKSPAQIEKMGNSGKEFCKEYAYTPMTGTTIAPMDDPRIGVKILSAKEAFAEHLEASA